MVSNNTFRNMALQYDKVIEMPHFEKQSYRIGGKKIFATLDEANRRAMLKLSAIDQSVFCAIDLAAIYPVPGTWGKQGATFFELTRLTKPLLQDAMGKAFLFAGGKA